MNAETTDPRVARTRERVVAATVELLAGSGFERITIEAIADRSGVARSTIYRNWEQRADLLVEAFERMCSFPAIPDLGSLADELRLLATDLAAGLQEEEWGLILPSLVGASFSDPEIAAAHQAFGDRRRALVAAVFRRAIERGDITADHDPAHLAEQFAAGFFFRRLVAHRPIDDAFIERQIAMVTRLSEF